MAREWWGMLATTGGGGAEPPPVTGGFKDPALNLAAHVAGGVPLRVAGTFHDGTIPGAWVPGGSGTYVTQSTLATWQVDITANLFGGTPLRIMFELNLDSSTQVEIYNATIPGSDTLAYSTVAVNPSAVALPVAGDGTIVGTITFTFLHY